MYWNIDIVFRTLYFCLVICVCLIFNKDLLIVNVVLILFDLVESRREWGNYNKEKTPDINFFKLLLTKITPRLQSSLVEN